MNLKKLKKHEGTTMSYIALCEILDTNKAAGNSKKRQLKEFKKLFDFKDQGRQGIDIIKIFDKEAQFTNDKYNRRNFTKVLFLDYLLSKSTNESISTIYIDKFRMFVELGLCNESYKKRYSDIIYNRVEVDHMTILEKEHFKTTYNSSYDLLKNIMDKLNEDTHIIKSYVYLISYQDDEKQKEASTKLHLKINEIKLDLCKNEEFIYTNDKGTKLSPSNPNMLVGDPYKYRLFMKMLNKILKKKYGIIKCNYVIKVTTSNTLIKLALDDSIKNIKRKNNKMTLEHIIQRIKIAAKKDVIYGEALIPVRVTIANKYNKI